MAISAEWQFAAVVILIYLLDGLVLLHVDEAVVECGRRRRILFGSQQPWIARRRVLLLAPWRPLATAWKLGWGVRDTLDPPDGTDVARALLDARVRAIARLAPWVCAVWLLVLVATPLTLVFATIPLFVLVAALAWLSVWALVLRLALLRRALDLSWSTYALVAFECVACPPVAANLPRKLSLHLSPTIDLMAFVDAPSRRQVHAQLAHDLDARLVFLDPDTPAHARTAAYRDLLLATMEAEA
ncbi:MAG TPA: hypothetical protein PKO41_04910 [Dokdonella sp.]|uniref:hypothetical protein n=1 Tax=Dokdonella sp. TaxID=2291710 RepID=UPI0025C0A9C9|nr:hypothetical protein [Dokdonella sp.]MBX3693139.1 hypothetical protein [Dokdonella sp.]MCW5567488.1 hypothetical protein [Dokdonella sp.]HNR91752.1 hypothetical protein [Dokdonella sp.]